MWLKQILGSPHRFPTQGCTVTGLGNTGLRIRFIGHIFQIIRPSFFTTRIKYFGRSGIATIRLFLNQITKSYFIDHHIAIHHLAAIVIGIHTYDSIDPCRIVDPEFQSTSGTVQSIQHHLVPHQNILYAGLTIFQSDIPILRTIRLQYKILGFFSAGNYKRSFRGTSGLVIRSHNGVIPIIYILK